MRVAFLFSGQFRSVPYALFRKSIDTLTKDLDYSIFSYCWDEIGNSLNHRNQISKLKKVDNIDKNIKSYFNGFNLVKSKNESFKEFNLKLQKSHKEILNSKKFHFGTVNSLPQIYTFHKCYGLLEETNEKFDLVFRCRYDSIFLHQLKQFPLEEIFHNNFLYNINFGRAYYPKRIYDVFFGGSINAMNFLSDIWDDLPSLVNSKFNNGLDNRDCCRILYLAAKLRNIKAKSLSSRICDVYRGDDYAYSKYLINSHLINSSLNKKNIIILKYIFIWFRERNLSNFIILFFFINAFLYFPFAYIKRLKYLKIC